VASPERFEGGHVEPSIILARRVALSRQWSSGGSSRCGSGGDEVSGALGLAWSDAPRVDEDGSAFRPAPVRLDPDDLPSRA
jgi:hypothetical protein